MKPFSGGTSKELLYFVEPTLKNKKFDDALQHVGVNLVITKDSVEVSLDRVLFAPELEFPKILVPRLPQHTSDVNIECAGKSEWSKQYLTVDNILKSKCW